MSTLDAALAYAGRGWAVFPCQWDGPDRKGPLTPRGYKDATTDLSVVRRWWQRWPRALIGTATGHSFVVLDIDTKPDRDGPETLARLGFAELPATLTARTGSGGWHLYFTPPAGPLHNTQGARGRGIGPGLDWRGVGGYVILPAPGTGYEWVESTLSLPLAAIPPELMPKEAPAPLIGTAAICTELTPHGEAALRSATNKIIYAPNGEQEATLNGESFSIGRLAGAGGVPAELALEILLTAGRGIPSYDLGRPWRPYQVEEKIRRAFANGLARPRRPRMEIEQELADQPVGVVPGG